MIRGQNGRYVSASLEKTGVPKTSLISQTSKKLINKLCLIDLVKDFDRIRGNDIWKVLKERGLNKNIIKGIKDVYKETYNNK